MFKGYVCFYHVMAKKGDITSAKRSKRGRSFLGTSSKRLVLDIHLLICNSCFWCASYLYGNGCAWFNKCPICSKNDIEALPIMSNERCVFDYDARRGVTLQFSAVNKQ